MLQEGKLCKNYEYIAKLRVYNAKLRAEEEAAEEEKQQEDQKWIFELHGHLFDKMLFNKTLDVLVERHKVLCAVRCGYLDCLNTLLFFSFPDAGFVY